MEDIKGFISSLKREDFDNERVNLHIHTTYSDGKADFIDIVKQAHEKGYEKIAISDHNTVQGYWDNPEVLNDNIIVPAVEFDVWCGYVFMHLLAYNIDVNSEVLKPFLAKDKRETESDVLRLFNKRDIKDLINAIHLAGGIAVLAHPACCWAISLDRFVRKLKSYGLDGMEVYYPYDRMRGVLKFKTKKRVEEVADKYNLLKTGGTDLHKERFWLLYLW